VSSIRGVPFVFLFYVCFPDTYPLGPSGCVRCLMAGPAHRVLGDRREQFFILMANCRDLAGSRVFSGARAY